MYPLKIFCGYDPREALAYHVCCNSIIRHASVPVSITPLALNTLASFYTETHKGTNQFIHSRFLVPYLCGFQGRALFIDGDMVFRDDVAKLFDLMSNDVDVAVVQHDYKTKYPTKYFGQKNEDYPRKNWSSVVLWNCGNHPNHILTPQYIAEKDSKFLHRFSWLKDERIQALPPAWNHLVDEYDHNDDAKLLHFTLAIPAISSYEDCDHSTEWWDEYHKVVEVNERAT
jgi:lipopolysaccharide biosynthesis glycosyltransferase